MVEPKIEWGMTSRSDQRRALAAKIQLRNAKTKRIKASSHTNTTSTYSREQMRLDGLEREFSQRNSNSDDFHGKREHGCEYEQCSSDQAHDDHQASPPRHVEGEEETLRGSKCATSTLNWREAGKEIADRLATIGVSE